eukprot:6173344-Pleurochrysis_carterae.AAC.2
MLVAIWSGRRAKKSKNLKSRREHGDADSSERVADGAWNEGKRLAAPKGKVQRRQTGEMKRHFGSS